MTFRIFATNVDIVLALIDVITNVTVAIETSVARTGVAAYLVGTFSVDVAIVTSDVTFIDILTFESIANVSAITSATIPWFKIDTGRQGAARVHVTFVNVNADVAITDESNWTDTVE